MLRDIKESYEELKEEETPFLERHQRVEKRWNRKYGKEIDSVPKAILFQFEKGAVHVTHEFIHQLDKFKYITKDPLPKFALRFRKEAGVILAAGIVASSLMGGNAGPQQEPINGDNAAEVVNTDEENKGEIHANLGYDDCIILTRVRVVQPGDNLSTMAFDSNTTEEKLMKINELSTKTIYLGDELQIPYRIAPSDLEYYNETINTNGKSLYDIAKEYETDVETLAKLNPEAVTKVGAAYLSMSDQIRVPKFVSGYDIDDLRSNQSNKQTNGL